MDQELLSPWISVSHVGDGKMSGPCFMGMDLSGEGMAQLEAIQHEMVVVWVKSTLKEVSGGPFHDGHTRSKAVPRSHAKGSRMALIDEDFS